MTFFRSLFCAYIFHHLLIDVKSEYLCICNYNVEWPVYGSVSDKGPTTGYLYEFDCKPLVKMDKLNNDWLAIAFEKQLGYVQKDAQVQVQTCPGHQPEEDKLTTTPHTIPTTTDGSTSRPTTAVLTTETSKVKLTMPVTPPISSTKISSDQTVTSATLQYITDNTMMNISSTLLSTVSTQTISTPSKLTPATVNVTSKKYVTTFSKVPPVNISATRTFISPTNTMFSSDYSSVSIPISSTISPRTSSITGPNISPIHMAHTTSHLRIQYDLIVGDAYKCTKNDTGVQGSFVSKFGHNCYELVTRSNRQWNFSEMYCTFHGGHLLSVSNRAEEEYIYQLLKWRNVTEPVWTGLNDQKYEEIFRWSSGEPVSYANEINWRNGRKGPNYYKEDCVLLDPVTYPGEWDDVDCHSLHAFICKYNVDESLNPPIIG